ncbi:hypothetical protein EX238_25245, partial [Providencia rettgeri]|nr:hypothetical protein [Providencia rettgeri]
MGLWAAGQPVCAVPDRGRQHAEPQQIGQAGCHDVGIQLGGEEFEQGGKERDEQGTQPGAQWAVLG